MQHRTRLWLTGVVTALIAVLIGALVGPQHQRVGDQTAGDPDLAARVRTTIDGVDGRRALAVAEVTSTSLVWAGLGNATAGRSGPAPTQQSLFQTGSVAKTFTAALFADAITRGEVTAEDRLSDHLPELAGTPAGEVTLGSLAQHSSGLPSLGATVAADMGLMLVGENPYATSSVEQLIADAAIAPVNADRPPTYSNFGFSLLGTALARAAETDYRSLLADRITGPLGMDHTWIPDQSRPAPADVVPGTAFNGTPMTTWPGDGYAPSGTYTLTSIEDLAIWAQALLAGTAPGTEALTPTADFNGVPIGWAWLTANSETGATVWHNGMTAGHAAIVVLSPDQDRAIVVLGNTDLEVDSVASALWTDNPEPGDTAAGTPAQGPTLSVSILCWIVAGIAGSLSLLALWRACRGRSALPVIALVVIAAAGLTLLWHSGPWHSVGGWLWGLLLAPTLAAVTIGTLRTVFVTPGTVAIPLRPARTTAVAVAGIALGALLLVGLAQLW